MTRFLSSSIHWLGRHAIPAVAVTLIAGAAAGGGIAYATTASHTKPSPFSQNVGPDPKTTAPKLSPGAPLARVVIAVVVKDTGLTRAAIRADLATQSLDQIAGANATKVENDVVALLTSRMSKRPPAFVDGNTSTLQTRVRARVHQLMSEPGTQVLALLNAHRGLDVPPPPQHPRPAFPRTPRTTPSPSPAA